MKAKFTLINYKGSLQHRCSRENPAVNARRGSLSGPGDPGRGVPDPIRWRGGSSGQGEDDVLKSPLATLPLRDARGEGCGGGRHQAVPPGSSGCSPVLGL